VISRVQIENDSHVVCLSERLSNMIFESTSFCEIVLVKIEFEVNDLCLKS